MHPVYVLLVVIAGALAISATIPPASGSLGGPITHAEPISFEGMEVTVRADITPRDLAVGSIDEVSLKIMAFDLLTYSTLEQVTYHVEIWKAEDLLARNLFYDDDGILYVKVIPDGNCNAAKPHMCTSYEASEHPVSPGALYVPGTECNDGNLDVCARPAITGPIFDKGGLYNIRIIIDGAGDPGVQFAERLTYDTFVSVTQEHDFSICTAQAGEIPVVVRTYYDEVSDLAFDPSDNSITFDMPFDWDPRHIGLVPIVHEAIQIPSSFAPYSDGTQFTGYVDGVEIGQRALLIDPYSIYGTNTIHFLVSQSELEKINAALGPEHHTSNNMNFRLAPIPAVSKNFAEFRLLHPVTLAPVPVQTDIRISWDGAYGADQTIPLEFAFFDSDRQPIPDVWYEYSVIDESDQVLSSSATADPNDSFILAPEGIDTQDIHVPTGEIFKIVVHVAGTGPDHDAAHSGIGSALVEIDPAAQVGIAPPAASQIPAWVKGSTALWTEGAIDDATFVQAIQFLVRQGVIDIPPTESGDGPGSGGIQACTKSNAALWTEGAIDDATFVQAIQFLVRQGVIVV